MLQGRALTIKKAIQVNESLVFQSAIPILFSKASNNSPTIEKRMGPEPKTKYIWFADHIEPLSDEKLIANRLYWKVMENSRNRNAVYSVSRNCINKAAKTKRQVENRLNSIKARDDNGPSVGRPGCVLCFRFKI